MFHFLIGLFIVVIIIMLMINSPAFRSFVFIVMIVVGLGIWWLFEVDNKNSERRNREQAADNARALAVETAALNAIKIDDLKFENVLLKKLVADNTFALTGVVQNDSKHYLEQVVMEVRIVDCSNNSCRTVGQERATLRVGVPSTQARSFESDRMTFRGLPSVSGARNWNYNITSIRAGS